MSDKTRETQFREIPAERCSLLIVASGVECTTALREAADLEDGVRRLLLMGTETGIDGSIAYLCEFALEIAEALRSASRE
jgi:hypothetical protein